MPQVFLTLFIILIVGFSILYLYLVLRHQEKVKLLNFASYVGLGIAFFMVLHLIILMVYPIKIQEVEVPLTVTNPNKEVKRGDYLTLQIHIKKYVDEPSIVSPTIICDSGFYYVYQNITSNLPIGEQTFTVPNVFLIPENIPLDTCRVRNTDTFKLNLFRSVSSVQESEDFKVIE
jgi:hypothetical protein